MDSLLFEKNRHKDEQFRTVLIDRVLPSTEMKLSHILVTIRMYLEVRTVCLKKEDIWFGHFVYLFVYW